MKTPNELINQVLNNESETQSTEQRLTIGERDLVNWFFMRLENCYGAKFWTQFSDEKTVKLTKREWAGRIIRYSREDLHEAIEKAKEERERGNEEFNWPDIPKILGLLKNRISPDGHNSSAYLSFDNPEHPEHEFYGKRKRIESDDYKTRKRKKGNETLSGLKGMFGSTPPDEKE